MVGYFDLAGTAVIVMWFLLGYFMGARGCLVRINVSNSRMNETNVERLSDE